jgi:hypothetical protein
MAPGGRVITIRPWEIFSKLPLKKAEVTYRIPLERGTETETIFTLETMLLIAVMRICNIGSFLELGTALGYNALNVAANTGATVTTVDKEFRNFVFHANRYGFRIKTITADIFDFSPEHSEMVFCDCNYSPETLQREWEICLVSAPRVIAWHDYDNPVAPDVTPFLDDLASEISLIRVADTRLVFWFKEPFL